MPVQYQTYKMYAARPHLTSTKWKNWTSILTVMNLKDHFVLGITFDRDLLVTYEETTKEYQRVLKVFQIIGSEEFSAKMLAEWKCGSGKTELLDDIVLFKNQVFLITRDGRPCRTTVRQYDVNTQEIKDMKESFSSAYRPQTLSMAVTDDELFFVNTLNSSIDVFTREMKFSRSWRVKDAFCVRVYRNVAVVGGVGFLQAYSLSGRLLWENKLPRYNGGCSPRIQLHEDNLLFCHGLMTCVYQLI